MTKKSTAKKVKLPNDFVAQDPRRYEMKIGTHVASSLSGFIAGAVVASIIWLAVIAVIRIFG